MFLTNSRTHFPENDRRHAHQTRFEEKPSGIVLHIDIKSDRSLNAARQRDRRETAFYQVTVRIVRFIAAFHHGKTINNKRRKRHQSHLANHDANHINAFGIANYNGNNQSNFADHGSKTHQYKTHQYYLVKLRLKTQQRHLAKKHHKSLTLPKTSLFTAFYSQKLCFANSIPSSLPSKFLKIFKNFSG